MSNFRLFKAYANNIKKTQSLNYKARCNVLILNEFMAGFHAVVNDQFLPQAVNSNNRDIDLYCYKITSVRKGHREKIKFKTLTNCLNYFTCK